MKNETNNTVTPCSCDSAEKYEAAERTVVPAADVFETDDSFIVKLDMPGSSKEGISLNVDSKRMEIRGTVARQTEENKKGVFGEIEHKDYYREFNLGNGIKTDTVSANYEDGVLTVTLPKAEEAKPKQIEVKVQ
jgi:HSP20 family protein